MKKIFLFLFSVIFLNGFSQEVTKQYDKIGKFTKGHAIVWKNGHCGLISQDGKEIIKPSYDKIGAFGNDAIAYTTKDGKMGLINLQGKIIVQNIYEDISGFKGFYAITRKNGLAGIINKSGKVLIDNKYESIKIEKNGVIRGVKDGKALLLDLNDK